MQRKALTMKLYQINWNGITQSKSLSFTADYCEGRAEDNTQVHDHNCIEDGDGTEEGESIHTPF